VMVIRPIVKRHTWIFATVSSTVVTWPKIRGRSSRSSRPRCTVLKLDRVLFVDEGGDMRFQFWALLEPEGQKKLFCGWVYQSRMK